MSAPDDQDIEALRLRVAELTQRVAHAEQRRAEIEDWLHLLLDTAKDVMGISEHGRVMKVNDHFRHMFGYAPDEVVGMPATELFAPEVRDEVAQYMRSSSPAPYRATCVRKDGSTFVAEVCGRVTTFEGRPARIALVRDITAHEQAEEAHRTAVVQREVIRAQDAVLAELSTPLLPITGDIIVLPLIGAVNAERAAQVIKALVEGVTTNQAKIAILDITGVPGVDASVAETLLKAARSASLLGAQVILTGVRPEVAQRFVALGTDLSGIMTHSTLERGVASALASLSRGDPADDQRAFTPSTHLARGAKSPLPP